MIDLNDIAPMLSVFDMPASLQFYCDVLGWRLGNSLGGKAPDCEWAEVKMNNLSLWLKTAYERDKRPSVPDAGRMMGHRDAILTFGCLDLDGAYAHLKAAGAAVQAPVLANFGMRQLFVTDPDGYVLCLQGKAKPRIV